MLSRKGSSQIIKKIICKFWVPLCFLIFGCQTIHYDEYQSCPTFTLAASSDIEYAKEIIDAYLKNKGFEKEWLSSYIYKEKYIAYKLRVVSVESMPFYCPNRMEKCEAIRFIPLYSFEKLTTINSDNSVYEWNNKISREILPLLNKNPKPLGAKHFSLIYNGGRFKPVPNTNLVEIRLEQLVVLNK